jgi:hypothetical protein
MAKAAALRKRGDPIGNEIAAVYELLDPIRQQIVGLLEQLDDVESAPLTEDEALQRLRAWVSSMADRAIIDGAEFTTRRTPRPRMIEDVLSGAGISKISLDAVIHWACAVFPEQVIEAYAKAIKDQYADGDGVSDAERDQTIKLLKEKLLALEIEEERIIVQAGAKGIYIRRRERLNPVALFAAAGPDSKDERK